MALNSALLRRCAALAFLACLAAPRAGRCEPGIEPQSAAAEELSEVKDRLSTSLFFRGELADRIMAAGMAGQLIELAGLETNAEVRSALLDWIKKEPARAAEIYLHLRSGGGKLPEKGDYYEMTWKLNPKFLQLIKELNDAAASGSVSNENLELASRRLYEGPQAAAPAPEVNAGAPSGSGFFSINYADYRLNKAGLGRELAAAGAWLDAMRGPSGSGPSGLESSYAAALSEYGAFVVAASSVKGRDVITAAESRALETRRGTLRTRLGVLALRVRTLDLGAMASSLESAAGEPGRAALLASIAALKERAEVWTARVGANGSGPGELGRIARDYEREFSSLYLRYSAYNGLLAFKKRTASPGFSCFYDYAVYRSLAAFLPAADYPRARAAQAAQAAVLDAALARTGGGDIAGALAGLEEKKRELEAAAAVTERNSRLNRAAQMFLLGLWFRPVELAVSAGEGRAAFRPVFTFFAVMRNK